MKSAAMEIFSSNESGVHSPWRYMVASGVFSMATRVWIFTPLIFSFARYRAVLSWSSLHSPGSPRMIWAQWSTSYFLVIFMA